LFIMAVVAAYVWKWPIHGFFRGDDMGVPDMIADVGGRCGDFPLPVSVGFLLALSGCITGRKNWMEAGAALLAAAMIAGIITLAGQFVLAEQRPYKGGAMRFLVMDGHGVSGHSTSGALLLWPITQILLRDVSRFIRNFAYVLLAGWVMVVAWSRMWNDKHFMWNVMLGLAAGLASGYMTVKANKELSENQC